MSRPLARLGLFRTSLLTALAAVVLFLPGCSENGKTITLTASNFEEKVLKSKLPVLVDFWAEWCGYCKQMDPVIKDLAATYEGKAVVGKLNTEDYPEISRKYGIKGLPTYLVFKNGELKHYIEGAKPRQYINDVLGSLQ
jgi:thioredoxin 1